MADYKLYAFGESGNCYKVALMLALTGTPWERLPVDFFNGETRTDNFRTVNEMGEAPVLLHDGKVLSQSGVILDYLAEQTGRFGADTADERREILRWILFDNHKFTSYYATLRFIVGLQKSGESPVTEFLRGRAKSAFAIVDKHLAGRDFLVADRLTIADLSLAGYVFFEEETGLPFQAYSNILAWRARIAAMPGWKLPYEMVPHAPPARA
ncbi:glutathione S-transferase family protein [Labrys sp. KB_33_2]|uniref:glutathione S-transferase family protein n=1 Tax=Labrys sp. KB_33_2 TaxID=3237479 RepID=UPI003F92F747